MHKIRHAAICIDADDAVGIGSDRRKIGVYKGHLAFGEAQKRHPVGGTQFDQAFCDGVIRLDIRTISAPRSFSASVLTANSNHVSLWGVFCNAEISSRKVSTSRAALSRSSARRAAWKATVACRRERQEEAQVLAPKAAFLRVYIPGPRRHPRHCGAARRPESSPCHARDG
jgi:hypothetical protein